MIVTQHICPPIPLRSHDWCAYDELLFDPENDFAPIGWGKTEQEAVADLLRQIEEANDDGA